MTKICAEDEFYKVNCVGYEESIPTQKKLKELDGVCVEHLELGESANWSHEKDECQKEIHVKDLLLEELTEMAGLLDKETRIMDKEVELEHRILLRFTGKLLVGLMRGQANPRETACGGCKRDFVREGLQCRSSAKYEPRNWPWAEGNSTGRTRCTTRGA